MKNRNRYILRLIILCLAAILTSLSPVIYAQSEGITANAPAVVTVDEAFSYTISGDKQGDVSLPALDDAIEVLAGPSQMVSYQSSNVNGKLQSTMQVSYTYMMKITKEGDYTIKPASLKVNRKTFQSNPVKIRVIKGASQAQSTSPANTENVPAAQGKSVILRQIPSKTNVYVGEQIVLSTKVYVRERLQITNMKMPSYEGFWNEDLNADKSAGQDVINGLTYSSQVINRQLLTAQKSGNLTLDPAEMDVMIQKRVKRKSNPFGDMFDDPFFDNAFNSYQTVPDSYKSNPVTIHVRRLPAGAPSSFDGAVGNYSMKASLSKDSTLTNESVTLRVTISGSGNLPLLQPLKVDFPPDLEVFDPKTTPKYNNTTSGSVGSVTFEYLVIPRNKGNFRIAPIEFSYFDPSSAKYISQKSKDFSIKVTGEGTNEDKSQMQQVPQGFFRDEVKNLGNDIRFIRTNPGDLSEKDESLLHSAWMLIYPVGMVLLIVLFVTRKRRMQKKADINYIRNRRARKLAVQRLKTAHNLLAHNNDGFFEEILKAYWGYLSDKFGVDTSDLSRESVQEKLEQVGVPEDIAGELWSLIEDCEFSRYAPGEAGDKNEVYERAENILSRIEESL